MNLVKTDRRILITMEEAGAETVVSLINSVQVVSGNTSEIDAVVNSLTKLLGYSLISFEILEIAKLKDGKKTTRSISNKEADTLLAKMALTLRWPWKEGRPFWGDPEAKQWLQAVLTPKGIEQAEKLVADDDND